MSPDRPLISIVTPCLNRVEFIQEAIESVRRQNYPGTEHIVVDGGSTDGTLDLLRRSAHLRVLSEPDEGLYDALNKGIRLARGEIIGHLNSDDVYGENIFSEIARRFAEDPRLDAVYGGAIVFDHAADGTRPVIARYVEDAEIDLSYRNVTIGIPISNARFFHRRVYDRVGLYDTRYRIAADRDFLLRVAITGIKSQRLRGLVYQYRRHPGSLSISAQPTNKMAILEEYLNIAERYLDHHIASRDVRDVCRRWHSREAVEGVVFALRAMRYSHALRVAMRGWFYNLWWPAVLMAHLVKQGIRMPSKVFDGRA